MGVLCSTVDKEGEDSQDGKAQDELHSTTPRKIIKMPQIGKPGILSQSYSIAVIGQDFETQAAYDKARASLQAAERAIGFDAHVVAKASSIENQAVNILKKIRLHDWDHVYGCAINANGSAAGMRTVGQHFLGNVEHINKTWLMDVAKHVPKGAHLHIHFNSCLPAKFPDTSGQRH